MQYFVCSHVQCLIVNTDWWAGVPTDSRCYRSCFVSEVTCGMHGEQNQVSCFCNGLWHWLIHCTIIWLDMVEIFSAFTALIQYCDSLRELWGERWHWPLKWNWKHIFLEVSPVGKSWFLSKMCRTIIIIIFEKFCLWVPVWAVQHRCWSLSSQLYKHHV